MIVEKISEFCSKKGFVQVVRTIRANTNGYKFLTFINASNEAENIYCSKALSSKLIAGEELSADDARSMQIAYTTNEAGEERIKLISNSERASVADLFG